MKTKTVNVNVQIQMDIQEGGDEVSQVQDVLELMNDAVAKSGIKASPQIFISDISSSDIMNQESDSEEENEEDCIYVSQFGNDYKCVEFFCTDRNVGGIDVSLDGEHIGEIIGLSFPDGEDKDECNKFDNEVIQWIVDNEE